MPAAECKRASFPSGCPLRTSQHATSITVRDCPFLESDSVNAHHSSYRPLLYKSPTGIKGTGMQYDTARHGKISAVRHRHSLTEAQTAEVCFGRRFRLCQVTPCDLMESGNSPCLLSHQHMTYFHLLCTNELASAYFRQSESPLASAFAGPNPSACWQCRYICTANFQQKVRTSPSKAGLVFP